MIERNIAFERWNADESAWFAAEYGPEPDEPPEYGASDDGPPDVDGQQPDAFEQAVTGLLGELLDSDGLDHIPRLEPLIDGFLYRDTLGRIIGPSGHMKSFVALDFAGHVGSGQPWCGQRTGQGNVIYLVAEGGGGIRKRVRAWEQHHRRKMNGVRFLTRPVQAADRAQWAVLTEAAKRINPALIIFDTQARVTVGVEENSSKEMGLVVARMDELRAVTKACVVLIHHQGLQGDHGRGSTAVKGALQTELRVTKKGKKGPDTRVIVSSDKQKDDEEFDDIAFAVNVVRLEGEAKDDGSPVTSVVLVPVDLAPSGDVQPRKRSPAGEKLLWALEQCEEPTDITRLVDLIAAKYGHGLSRETASRKLNTLLKDGLIDRIDQGNGKSALWLQMRTK